MLGALLVIRRDPPSALTSCHGSDRVEGGGTPSATRLVQKKNGHQGSGPESIASSAPTAGSSASRKPSRTASTGRRYPENIEENVPIGSGRRSCGEPRSTFGSPAETLTFQTPVF